MLHRSLLAVLAVAVFLADPAAPLCADQRDIAATPRVEPGSLAIAGGYWALIIGIDEYRHVPKLTSAVRDAQAVREVLIRRYGFARDKVVEIINGQATREGIENALYQLRKKAGANDSVFIYYAGHGQIDQEDQIGYWVPVEGKAQSPGTFISNARIRDEIGRMKAKHVYLVADSCFSGTLFASGRALPPLNDKFYARLYANKSRWGLTSGMNEPVTDAGKDGHSMFAYFFLKLLRENEDPYLVPSHIFDQIAPLISRNTEQQPRSEPLQNAGDEGGQFVFRLVSRDDGPVAGVPPQARAAPSEDVAQLKKRLEELEGRLAKPAEPPKPTEEARARPYEAPQGLQREITGKDGASMVLIPAGEFMMGSTDGEGDEKPVHRVSLDDYYMDRYEVTTSRYAKFLRDTSRTAPTRWDEASQASDGERPVIGVDWHDADAYCRYYGKRLPTEAEWEKAARGTDGRTYPWGNEAPTTRLAKYDTDGKAAWQGYATLASAESYEAGKSPYGLYHMAGNVWEWVADWYDKTYYQNSPDRNPTGPASGSSRVLRGGSWAGPASHVRSAGRGGNRPANRYFSYGFRCAKTP